MDTHRSVQLWAATFVIYKTYTWKTIESNYKENLIMFQWVCSLVLGCVQGHLSRMCPTDDGLDICARVPIPCIRAWPMHCRKSLGALPCFTIWSSFIFCCPAPLFSKSWSLKAQELLYNVSWRRYNFNPSCYSYFMSSSKSRQGLIIPNLRWGRTSHHFPDFTLRCSRELHPGFCNQSYRAKAVCSVEKSGTDDQPSP